MIRIINTGAGLILGLQYVRLSGACPVFPECTVASQAVATGLVCAAQKGCSLPRAVDGPASLVRHGVRLQDMAPIRLECVNLKRLLPTL